VRINRLTFIFYVFKGEERGGESSRRRRRRREKDASPPLARVFKTDPTLVIYKILEKTLVL
jgi:hypothetical protein